MTAERAPFYRRLGWWLAFFGGFFLGWAISEFVDHGPVASAWLSLAVGVALYVAAMAVIARRYR